MDIKLFHTKRDINQTGRNITLIFTLLIITVLIMFALDIILGSVTIRISDVLKTIFGNAYTEYSSIIIKFRIPKAITALLAGIALSVSGLQMQTIFRNPMAGPYVLGISAGASLGVAFVILGFSEYFSPYSIKTFGNWALAAASWLGAGIVMIIMMYISLKVKDILAVLILGIMLSGGISSIVSIMQYFSNETMLKSYVIWTMGSLGNLSSAQLKVMAASIIAGILLTLISLKMLNVLLLGETYAESLGLNLKTARILVFTATCLLTGTVTAFCGPIGFIGIAVPHIARIIFRTSDHYLLVPSVILLGGIIMLFSDIVSQLPGTGKILPVNAVTSLVGIPVVIWVVLRARKYSSAL